jgi:DNA-binding transcriptional regulator YhcF (GntR family)
VAGQRAYERIAESLEHQIRSGTLATQSQLPSEASLASSFGVNRLTLRRALEQLAQTGLIESRQGAGTFVRNRSGGIALPIDPTAPVSATVDHLLREHQVEAEQLAAESSPPAASSESTQERAGLTLSSLLTIDANVRLILRVTPPWSGHEGGDEGLLASTGRLAAELESRATSRSTTRFLIESADADGAGQLRTRPGAPLLSRIDQVTDVRSQDGLLTVSWLSAAQDVIWEIAEGPE